MLSVKIISVGTLKESYWRDAVAEYSKRLSAYCKLSVVELKESRVSDSPSEREIASALDAEAGAILKEMSPRAYKIAMCVEGKQLTSERLAERIEAIGDLKAFDIVFFV